MWSAEEQTMLDLMELNGFFIFIDSNINSDFYVAKLYKPNHTSLPFKADTEYEALRKAFNYWTKNNEAI
jgi:hypothetical protein